MSLLSTPVLRWLSLAATAVAATHAVACTVDEPGPKPPAPLEASASTQSRMNATEPQSAPPSGVVPQGAGMPIVPIRRADAGVGAAGAAAQQIASGSVPNQPSMSDSTSAPVDAGSSSAEPGLTTDAGASSRGTALTPASPLQPSHRFDFSGTGTQVLDAYSRSFASLSGGAQLDGAGAVNLPGEASAMVALPEGLLERLEAFTLLVWITPRSEACWQRAVEFLDLSTTAGSAPDGTMQLVQTLLYLTPYSCRGATVGPALGYRHGDDAAQATGGTSLALGQLVQLGMSYNAETQSLQLIQDGVVVGEALARVSMPAIRQARARVGRSSYEGDPAFDGTVTELRIYSTMLEPEALLAIFERGPDNP